MTTESTCTVSFVEEIKKQRFYDAFDDVETVVLEMAKKTWDAAVSECLVQTSKKCPEQLSMALEGSKICNEVMEKLRPILWFGNVNKAIQLLHGIGPEKIKNQTVITQAD